MTKRAWTECAGCYKRVQLPIGYEAYVAVDWLCFYCIYEEHEDTIREIKAQAIRERNVRLNVHERAQNRLQTVRRALRASAVAAYMLAGCTVDRVPIIAVEFDQTDVPADIRAYTIAGATAWQSLDVEYSDDKSLDMTACPNDWYATPDALPCLLQIHVTYSPGSELGGAGLTNWRHIYLQLEISGDQLAEVAAHEAGHAIWNSSYHLADGEIGIMSNPASSLLPTDADRAYVAAHAMGWQ